MVATAARVGIMPDQFWGLTFAEFNAVCGGYSDKLEHERTMLAWACANIMNMWAPKGRRITVQRLLGKGNIKRTSSEVYAAIEARQTKD